MECLKKAPATESTEFTEKKQKIPVFSVLQILKAPQLDTFPFNKLALESFPCILKRK